MPLETKMKANAKIDIVNPIRHRRYANFNCFFSIQKLNSHLSKFQPRSFWPPTKISREAANSNQQFGYPGSFSTQLFMHLRRFFTQFEHIT